MVSMFEDLSPHGI